MLHANGSSCESSCTVVYLILKVIAVKQLTHTHREGKGQNDCWEDMKHFQGTPLFGKSSSGNATATDWGEGQHCCPLLLCCVLRFQISVNNWLVVFLWEWTILPHFLVGFIPTQSKGPWLCSLCCLLLTRARTACILLGFCSPTVTCSPPSTQHGNKQLCPAHHMELQHAAAGREEVTPRGQEQGLCNSHSAERGLC